MSRTKWIHKKKNKTITKGKFNKSTITPSYVWVLVTQTDMARSVFGPGAGYGPSGDDRISTIKSRLYRMDPYTLDPSTAELYYSGESVVEYHNNGESYLVYDGGGSANQTITVNATLGSVADFVPFGRDAAILQYGGSYSFIHNGPPVGDATFTVSTSNSDIRHTTVTFKSSVIDDTFSSGYSYSGNGNTTNNISGATSSGSYCLRLKQVGTDNFQLIKFVASGSSGSDVYSYGGTELPGWGSPVAKGAGMPGGSINRVKFKGLVDVETWPLYGVPSNDPRNTTYPFIITAPNGVAYSAISDISYIAGGYNGQNGGSLYLKTLVQNGSPIRTIDLRNLPGVSALEGLGVTYPIGYVTAGTETVSAYGSGPGAQSPSNYTERHISITIRADNRRKFPHFVY